MGQNRFTQNGHLKGIMGEGERRSKHLKFCKSPLSGPSQSSGAPPYSAFWVALTGPRCSISCFRAVNLMGDVSLNENRWLGRISRLTCNEINIWNNVDPKMFVTMLDTSAWKPYFKTRETSGSSCIQHHTHSGWPPKLTNKSVPIKWIKRMTVPWICVWILGFTILMNALPVVNTMNISCVQRMWLHISSLSCTACTQASTVTFACWYERAMLIERKTQQTRHLCWHWLLSNCKCLLMRLRVQGARRTNTASWWLLNGTSHETNTATCSWS